MTSPMPIVLLSIPACGKRVSVINVKANSKSFINQIRKHMQVMPSV